VRSANPLWAISFTASSMMFDRPNTIPRSVGLASCSSWNSDPVAPPTSTATLTFVVSIAYATLSVVTDQPTAASGRCQCSAAASTIRCAVL
jgi:hypothetical protein